MDSPELRLTPRHTTQTHSRLTHLSFFADRSGGKQQCEQAQVSPIQNN